MWIVQGEKKLVEARSTRGWVGCASIKKFGTGLRRTCPRGEENFTSLVKIKKEQPSQGKWF
jgi:hypothetical protein